MNLVIDSDMINKCNKSGNAPPVISKDCLDFKDLFHSLVFSTWVIKICKCNAVHTL